MEQTSTLKEQPVLKRLLVVDDEEGILVLMKKTMRQTGIEVFTAESAEDAMAMLRKGRFDLLMADIMMPGMNGLELIAKARKMDPEICCVIMTAYANLDTFTESVQKGALDFISKPFDLKDLHGRLLDAYERQKKNIEALERRAKARLANLDPLTELLNPRQFYVFLDKALTENPASPVAVLLVDVTALRVINETFGIESGDEVLRSLARILEKRFPSPAAVCRFGGDEFMIMLPETSGEEASVIARKLRAEITRVAAENERGEIPVTLSTAAAASPEDGAKSFLLVNAVRTAIREEKNRPA